MREPARLSESELFWRKRKCARSESLIRQAKGGPHQRRNPMPRPNEETMTQSAQAVRREALTEVTLSPTRYVVSFRQACLPRACRSGNFEPNRDLVLNLKAW